MNSQETNGASAMTRLSEQDQRIADGLLKDIDEARGKAFATEAVPRAIANYSAFLDAVRQRRMIEFPCGCHLQVKMLPLDQISVGDEIQPFGTFCGGHAQ